MKKIFILEKIMRLQPAQYEMLNANRGDAKTIGFIAQDVKSQSFFHQIIFTNIS